VIGLIMLRAYAKVTTKEAEKEAKDGLSMIENI
jgi:hypothetical protein